MAVNRIYGATGLIGGTTGDLDTIDGADLANGDMAIVINTDNNRVYFYKMDATGSAAESSPDVIIPDSNNDSDAKNWELQEVYAPTMLYSTSPGTDLTATGIKSDMTVGANTVGIGSALYMATDGGLDEADADAASTMPCIAVALETGTGASKTVLLQGFIRKDAWNWTSIGQPVYVSATVGTFTQTAPAGSGDQVQIVGIAITADIIYFRPDLTLVEVA
jgi:hypothetical protein